MSKELADYGKLFDKVGKNLVSAALDKFKTDEKARMVAKVEQLVSHLRDLHFFLLHVETEIKLFETRLQQVYDGETTVDAAGMMRWKDGFYV